ncbi:MAG: alkylhydroperoxidase [Hoeflea sp. BRH_c9]|nr:MAG: alkylhydroperoxidase [Hoeflea sp. BRH_c9]
MTMTTRLAAVAAAALLSMTALAVAAELPTAEETYKEIEATYGVLPGFMKAYPKNGIAGAWAMTKGLEIDESSALDPKIKSLINIAVAAQIPCRYCVWLDTKFAKQMGATDDEIAAAVAQAGLTRNWSAILNGLQIDFDTFKAEFGGE